MWESNKNGLPPEAGRGRNGRLQMEKIIVASVTPFYEEGALNEKVLQQLWERNLAEGASGFFLGGSSGECFLLTREERLRVFELGAAYRDRAEIIAHVGAISTAEAVVYAREARRMGIREIAATPPTYFGLSAREIARYYYDIAEAFGGSVMYYNIPTSTHRVLNLEDPDTRRLLESGVIGGIKHTNLNLLEMERIRSINPNIRCFGGFESCAVAFQAFGCEGLIGSSFNFMTPQFKRILTLCGEGKQEEARTLQTKANNVLEVLLRYDLCAGLKYMLSLQGIPAGDPRRPMLPLTEEQKKALAEAAAENLDEWK